MALHERWFTEEGCGEPLARSSGFRTTANVCCGFMFKERAETTRFGRRNKLTVVTGLEGGRSGGIRGTGGLGGFGSAGEKSLCHGDQVVVILIRSDGVGCRDATDVETMALTEELVDETRRRLRRSSGSQKMVLREASLPLVMRHSKEEDCCRRLRYMVKLSRRLLRTSGLGAF
ncbi:unnamed protein product [Arabis nemorensis]|uniref:Uncharacterized protein n=1 Tax=Arabis nemorensis TaxID=586526 RepID=A0A565CSX1_9BRAS|nr:unnamed protein product [Arabis nemorensis]